MGTVNSAPPEHLFLLGGGVFALYPVAVSHAAATFSPTGAELRVTEDLRQAAQDHPPMVDALSGESAPIA